MPTAPATGFVPLVAAHHPTTVLVRVGAVVAAFSLLIGAAVGLVAWELGVAVALVAATAAWFGVVLPRARRSEARAVARLDRPRPADPRSEARLLNLVEGLAATAGVDRADCLVLHADAPNALVTGSRPRQGTIVVTTGLLAATSRMELEAVVAHCLVRLRDGAVTGATTALAFAAGGWLVGRALAGDDLGAADVEAAGLTRYPPGLISALEAIAASDGAPLATDPALAPLWLARPSDGAGLARRIAALEEL